MSIISIFNFESGSENFLIYFILIENIDRKKNRAFSVIFETFLILDNYIFRFAD